MMQKPLVAFFIWIFIILTGFSAIAQTGPQLNYHGRIVDGITNLGVSGMRNFRIQVRTPAGLADNCLMYEETQSKNLVNGVFVINLNNGSGVRADATAPVYTVQQIFSNKNSFGSFSFAGSRCVSTNPFTYTPGPTDSRRVNIWFEDPVGAPGVWEPLPTQTVAYVPSAIESLNVGGFPIEALLRVVDVSGNPSTLPTPMSEAQYTNLMSLTSGSVVTSINGLAGAPVAITGTSGTDFNITTSGSNINFNIPSSSAANRGLLTAADWSLFNAKMPNTGAAVSAALGYTPLAPANNLSDLSNAATARGNLGLGTSATMSVPGAAAAPASATEVVRGDDPRLTGAIVAGSAASGDLSGTYPNPTVARVGGRTAVQINQSVTDTLAATDAATASTIVKRDASGNASFATAQATNFSGNNFFVFNSGNANSIQIAAPTPLPSGDYILTLPDTAGTAGYVLSTDGAGNTTWIDPSGTSVTAVNANPPLSSSGGFTPTISISQSNTTTAGYLSSTDWTTFNNKLSTTLSTGQVWVGDGTNVAAAQFLNISNIRSTVAGAWFNAGACAAGEILSYSAVTDQVTCTAMSLTGSQVATALSGIMSGDASISAGGTLTIANNAVTNAKINSVAWSKVTGTPTTYGGYGITDITLANAGNVNTVEAGLDAARGAFGTLGRVYFSTDSREIWYDTGAAWLRVGSNAGLGGTVTSVAVNAPLSLTGVATVNPTISLPQATVTADGYLSSSDFTNFAGKVNRAGDTMTGALNMGSNNITAAGNIAMSANRNIQIGAYASDPACTAPDAGKVWYHTPTGALHYCDGVTVQSLGSLSGVVTGINGLTGSVNLVLGSAGTDASINTASPNITLNLPTSSAANRGLLSSTDWSNFNSKQAGSTELTGVAALATTGFVQRTGAGTYATVASVDLTTSVSGVLPIANGGTNATTANAALNNLLPSQATHANKFLQTNGAGTTSWADISSVAVTSVTAAATAGNPIVIAGTATAPTIDIPRATTVVSGYLSSTDFTTFNNKQSTSLATGQVWVGSAGAIATPQFLNIANIRSTVAGNWFNAGACASGEILSYSAVTDQVTCAAMTLTGSQVATALSGIMSGDATISAAGTLTIGNDKITAAMIAPNSVAWSTDVTGKPTTIAGYGITDAVLINAGGISTMEANLDASRGAAGTVGRVYVSRDTGEIWYDTGATWVRVGSNAGLGGTVTNVTGTAPISVATGTSTPVVSMTRATGVVDGYLAATDFVTFNSKMSSDFSNATGTLAIANGGTGAATASGARTNLGLGTADSPTFTGLTVSGVNGNTLVRANGSGVLANATSSDITGLLGFTPTSSTLSTNMIFVGNASNVATGVLMSGDASIVSSGTITLKNTGTAGTYGSASAVPTITTDAQGRVTGVTTNAYQDATAVTKGILQVGNNLQVAGGTISLQNATTAQTGALTSTDWTTFNNKQGALGFTPLNPANNLSDVASADVSRTNLGLGIANSPVFTGLTLSGLANGFVKSVSGVLTGGNTVALSTDVTGVLPVANGGTGLSSSGANGNVMYVAGGTFATATPDTVGLVDKTNAQTIAGVKTFTANPIIDNAGVVQFREATAGGTNFVGLKAPNALAADVTFTLPGADGTVGQVLRTDGAGNLSWVSGATGTVTSVTSANADIGVATTTTTPVLTLNSGLGASQIAKVGAVGIANNTVVVANGAGGLAGQALTDGQLIIGSTGAAPVAAGITGTANRVTVTNGAGTITLTGPQDIHSGASPTFTGLTLSGVTGNTLVRANGSGVLANATSADITGLLGFTPGAVSNVSGTAPISVATGTSTPVVSITRSTAGVDGYLAATDFVTFNSKMSSDFSNATGTLAIANGGTGAVTAGAARTNLGVGTGDSPSFTGLTVSGVTGNTLLRASGAGVVANATSADVTGLLGFTPATNALAANMIFVGNGSNIATAVAMSGDASIVSSGTITLKNTGTAGTYGSASAVPTITTDAQGRVTGVTTNAYQDATAVTKGILQVGTNLQVAGGTISLQNATAAQAGALTSSDWTMFNAKLSATITAAATGQFIRYDGTNWVNAALSSSDLTASLGYTPLNPANNLSDVANAATSRTNLGLGTGNSPSFTGLTLSGVTGNTLLRANGTGVVANATSADITGLLGFTPGSVTSVTSANTDIGVATTTTTPVLTLNSGLGASQIAKVGAVGIANNTVVVANGAGGLAGQALTNGQLLIGSTGVAPVAAGITGTANQITVTNGAGSITLSTPQDIHSGASPSFTGLTVSGVTGNTLLRANGTGVVANATSADITGLLGFTPGVGTVTNVTGTAPISVATGTSTPVVSIARSTASVDGYLASTDFTMFNSKMSSDFSNATGTLAIANGGTGAATASGARTNLGLGTGDSPSFTGLTVSGVTGNTLLRASGAGVVANATSADVTGLLGFTPATNVLAANMIFVGNGSNIATAVAMSGDASIVSSGTITLKNTGTAGTYGSASAVPTITTDAQGRVTGVTTNAYQDATGVGKGIVQVGNNISVAAGVISVATADGSTTGVITSSDWTRFDSKLSATIAAPATGQYIRYNGTNWVNSLMVSSDITTSLGYAPLNPANNLSDVANAATSRTNLGLGTGNSPSFTGLTLSGVTGNTLVRSSGAGLLSNATSADITGLLGFTPGVGTVTNVTGTAPISVATGTSTPVVSIARSTASVDGYLASTDFTTFNSKMSSDFSNATGTLAIANGGTGAVTAGAARTNLGVGTGDSPSFTGLTVSGVTGNTLLRASGTGVVANATSADITGLLGFTPGSVTSITAGAGLTGGTITTTGTIGLGTELAGLNSLATLGFIQRTAAGAYSTVSSIDLTTSVTGALPIVNGGTGAVTVGAARTNFGLGTADSPSFTGLTLSGVTGNTLVRSSGAGLLSNATSADITGLLGFTPGSVTSVTSANTDIGVATTTTTPVLTLNSGLAANQIAKVGAVGIANNTVVVANGAGGLAGQALTNGQLLIGSTGVAPVAAGITGTANQITVTNGAGSITLSTPQDIHSGASPSFTGLTVSGVTGNTLLRANGTGVVANATSADITGLLGFTPGVGTVTNVTGTAPISVATGTSTPVVSIARSTASVDGYLASTDFTTFNSKMSSDFSNATGTLAIANGGTGAVTAGAARTNLGVGTGDSPSFTGLTVSGVTGNTLLRASGTGVVANATSADITTLLGFTPSAITSIAVGTGMTGGGSSGAVSVGVNAELQGLSGLATTGFVTRTGAGAYSTQTSIVLSTDVTGALPIANGGTGATTATAALTNLLPAQSANSVLQSNGTITSWLTFNPAASNNTLVQRDGSGVLAGYGFNVSGATSGAVTFTAPAIVTTYSLQLPAAQGGVGTVLQNNGSGVLSWASSVAASTDLTNSVTGILPVANGGTGLATGTSGGIPYFSAATTMASSGVLAANGVMLGGGAGVAPTTTVAGTANQVLRIPGGGGAPVFGSIDLSSTAAVTNSLGVANGGTGAATLTAGSLVVGNGTTAVNFLTAGTLGNVIYATGAATWASGTPTQAGLVAQNGNSYAATMTVGTNDANQLNLETNNSVRMSFDTSGAVRVNGQAYSQVATSSAATPLTWDANSSNTMRWSINTSTITANIHNMKPGAAYQLIVSGTGTGTTTINCFSDAGVTALTQGYMPANGNRVTGTRNKTVYTLMSDGESCLVTWITGF